MSQTIADMQIEIDALFKKLDQASTGGEVTQTNHALRVKISRKRQLGGRLNEREKSLIGAVGGEINATPGRGVPIVPILVLALLLVAGWIVYRMYFQP